MIDPLFNRDQHVIQYPDSEGPVLTEEMVTSAERELGVTLPGSYVDLMQECNGGYTNNAAIGTTQPTSWAPDHVQVNMIFGIPATGDAGKLGVGQGILQTAYMTAEWGLPESLVLLDGEGHWWIALDYRTSGPGGPPSVVWIDIEQGEDVQLAASFDVFRDQLRPVREFDD